MACNKDSEEESLNAATLESVEFDEFSIFDEYLSEPEETLDVSLHEPDITIAQSTYDEVEKYIEVISKRPEEPQKESKEDQPRVLVKPPTLPSIFVRHYKGVDLKERSRVFNTIDTLVLADNDLTDSFVDLGDHSQVSGAHLEARVGSYRDKYRVIGVRLRIYYDQGQGDSRRLLMTLSLTEFDLLIGTHNYKTFSKQFVETDIITCFEVIASHFVLTSTVSGQATGGEKGFKQMLQSSKAGSLSIVVAAADANLKYLRLCLHFFTCPLPLITTTAIALYDSYLCEWVDINKVKLNLLGYIANQINQIHEMEFNGHINIHKRSLRVKKLA
ncbi:hypothetical protein Sjap_018080 [Stephania japonica]|uniref:Uncharacterized protein n=1 Tax=Stephania japonica TaxID=461633 RepID=A0AAP0NL65_9MAGN